MLDGLVTALGRTIKRRLAPGDSETYRLVFDAPEGTTDLTVQFRFGGPVGTFLDNVLVGKRQVAVTAEKG